ncbi:MAG: AAA-like domain-containing protein [Deltaproteobacteria bacterium]|jgi:hypothetical protein|nr:AAA-like domain-containing protein [Deltaproteobacteria bacterium]
MERNPIKIFNTFGPCNPEVDYMIPSLEREPAVMPLIDKGIYFAIHAPRQSGKTTLLSSLTNKINEDGKYYPLYCSLAPTIEADSKEQASEIIFEIIIDALKLSIAPCLNRLTGQLPEFSMKNSTALMGRLLTYICTNIDKPLVVFFDEADSIPENATLSFLAQIRDGFNKRKIFNNNAFPKSIALVGLRDLKDYRTHDQPDNPKRLKLSPFNIQHLPLGVPNFSKDQIRALYKQHTVASGQVFRKSSIEKVWEWTEGQPWLVNALARDIIGKQLDDDYSIAVDGSHVDKAANELIKRNEVHLSSLIDRLNEPRVRMVMAAIVSVSDVPVGSLSEDDIKYCVDLGLLKLGNDGLNDCAPANLIYNEVIFRALSSKLGINPKNVPENKWMDGKVLDMTGLLRAFQDFWLENAEILSKDNNNDELIDAIIEEVLSSKNHHGNIETTTPAKKAQIRKNVSKLIKESLCVLVLCAFLQRVLNGGAETVRRQHSLGSKFLDICVYYKEIPYPIEVKIKGTVTTESGIIQLLGYIGRCKTSQGWLVEFDRNPNKPSKQKLTFKTCRRGKNTVFVVGC